MRLERYQKVRSRLQESGDKEFSESFKAQQLELSRVNQPVKQIAWSDFLIENNGVHEGDGHFVTDVRQVLDALGPRFFVKPGIGNPAFLELDDAHAVQQSGREEPL